MDFTDLRILKTNEHLQNALLELLEVKKLNEITVKEICSKAGISRNAFYQHYSYKEDLYNQMLVSATERIRNSLTPVIPDASKLEEKSVAVYSRHIVSEISKIKELLYVMLKDDDGKFLKQLTDLIFNQNMTNALSFFNVDDTKELRYFYEFLSAGMASFIIKWVLDDDMTEEKAAELLTAILLQTSTSPLKKREHFDK